MSGSAAMLRWLIVRTWFILIKCIQAPAEVPLCLLHSEPAPVSAVVPDKGRDSAMVLGTGRVQEEAPDIFWDLVPVVLVQGQDISEQDHFGQVLSEAPTDPVLSGQAPARDRILPAREHIDHPVVRT